MSRLPIQAIGIYVDCYRKPGDMVDVNDHWIKTLLPGKCYVIDLSADGHTLIAEERDSGEWDDRAAELPP
jgi:hypothetical protein